jgi:hypothetical protein
MKIDQSTNWIKKFLLGELKEADQTAIERELLADRDKFEQVCAVEDDLIDSYLRGKMSRGDRERFEIHYLASQYNREHVASAQILIAEIDRIARERVTEEEIETNVSWWKRFLDSINWLQPALGLALVLAILVASGALWLYLERARLLGEIAKIENEAQIERASFKEHQLELESRSQVLEREIANERQRYEEAKAALEKLRIRSSFSTAVLSFLLTPATVRGEKTQPSLTLPLLTGKLRFLMELNDFGYAGYKFRLQTVEGREILRGHAGKISLGKDRKFAAVTIEAGKLTKGDYILILSGQTADGRDEEIDRSFLQVS